MAFNYNNFRTDRFKIKIYQYILLKKLFHLLILSKLFNYLKRNALMHKITYIQIINLQYSFPIPNRDSKLVPFGYINIQIENI